MKHVYFFHVLEKEKTFFEKGENIRMEGYRSFMLCFVGTYSNYPHIRHMTQNLVICTTLKCGTSEFVGLLKTNLVQMLVTLLRLTYFLICLH